MITEKKKSKVSRMQSVLLQMALEEQNLTKGRMRCDHRYGINYVNNVTLNIKYPMSHVYKCNNLDTTKKYEYTFKGGFNSLAAEIERKPLLESYIQRSDSVILDTKDGIYRKDKGSFDTEYYQLISNGKYSLCPNWGGPWWDHEFAWTYRFIETCFAKSIPILFKETPLGKTFIKDIFFLWDHESHDIDDRTYHKIVKSNYKKAIQYWTLRPTEIAAIGSYTS